MAWARRLGWAILGVLVLWALAWLAVPPLLKSQAESRLGELLGRGVQIAEVEFRPWTLELTIRGLTVAAAPGAGNAAPQLQLARLHVDGELGSLLRWAPVVDALQIDGLRLRATRTADGHFDIDDLLARLAQRPPPEPGAGAPRFAIYNVELRDAAFEFDDRPVGRVHRVEALTLALPFISNLPAEIDVKVTPRLAFTLDKTRFDSDASATPFARTRQGELEFDFKDFDLRPYVGYLPAGLPLRLQQGRASAQLRLSFALPENAAPQVALKGSVALNDLALADTQGTGLLAWKSLALELRELKPLSRELNFGTLRIDGAVLDLVRDSGGRLALQLLLAPAAKAGPAAAQVSAGASTPAAGAAPGWHVSLDGLQLDNARVQWTDATTRPRAALAFDDIAFKAGPMQWPMTQPSPLTMSATLRAARGAAGAPAAERPVLGRLALDGQASEHAADLALRLDGLRLEALAPYAGQLLAPRLAGRLQAAARLQWSADESAPRRTITLDSARIDALQLVDGKQQPVALERLTLADAHIDLLGRRASVGSLELVKPRLALARDADGRWNAQRWAVAAAPTATAATPAQQAAHAGAGGAADAPWQVQLKALRIDGGQLGLRDAAAAPGHAGDALQLQAGELRLRAADLAWPADARTPPITLQLSTRIGDPAAPRAAARGLVDWSGRVGLQPLRAEGTLRIERLPVHLFERYFGDALAVDLVHAEAGYRGHVALRQQAGGWRVDASGDALVGDLMLNARSGSTALADGRELLSWQALRLEGLTVAIAPGSRPAVGLRELILSDFFARLVVSEQGRLLLQDADAPPAPARASAASAPASSAAAAAAAASAAAAGAVPLPLDLSVGATRLVNGKVDFSDHFIRPNYSAQLTELNGQLGAFRSDRPEMAALELRGRAAGTALLDIRGSLNPATRPPALDIRAKVSDLELAPLSPYSGKYAGYAIERGKLSVDLSYRITADGKLDATNQVILNQLTFGDKVASPDATKLPVLLAVSLLKDSHGVIDINLPVSGSLQDPQFSVGGIIWKVIVNLLTKALTAPFSLLAGGGGADLSVVDFVPGTATIAPAAAASVDKVAKALADRPSLTMTVTGSADLQAESQAYRHAALEARLHTEARREALRSGGAPAAAASASAPAPLAEAERARLLKSVYQQTQLPDKPRNAVGLASDIPGAQMQSLLEAAIVVDAELMRELALQRGLAVRDALVAKGLGSERLFLAAPKLHTAHEGDATWTPRAQLSLAVNR